MDDETGLDDLTVTVQNIGGISESRVTLSPRVTLLVGENASNKSSFLRSLSAVLGGPTPPLKSDATSGRVDLEMGTDEYYIELAKQNGTQVVAEEKRLTELEDLCELFVTLDETNPIRQAVVNDGDLYDHLMRPIDTESIEYEIEQLKATKDDLSDQLSELDRKEDRLPGLETRATSLRQEIENVESTLRKKRSTIEELEGEQMVETDAGALKELKEKRSERETVRNRIRTQKAAIESLEKESDSIETELNDLDLAELPNDADAIVDEIEQLHHQKQQLTTTINSLSPIVEMNSQLLDDDDEIPAEMKSDDIVAELDPDSRTITCWTCGSSVEQSEIAEQVRVVQEILEEKRDQRETITDHIQTLDEQRRQFEQQRQKHEQLQEQKRSTEAEIERRTEQLSELESRQQELKAEVETLLDEIEESGEQSDELGELYDEVSDLEYERGQLENELTDIEAEIEGIETELSNRESIEAQRESVVTQLQDQRDRIETLERDFVTTFNEMMQQVLDRLDYEKVERIWTERITSESDSLSGTEFELHIVRSTEKGTVFEDVIENLSKSEREVIGLVVALAGYLAHDVVDELPFIIVDAVEMLDAMRIHSLLEYFNQYTDYVIMAVLPEEGKELEDAYSTISTSSFGVET
ncbi:archaea-specific SMC-related protein [Halocatena salina]|uniref:AAA family ATPase n=1 Tax=Halocatena salina TaxID=2934340 RepID=A0A8U0A708_9EURY|nr:archaea-specific SMC-related protein [Halocatena salina]UPM44892.1 AAA family ATPase [Halocatena salina]